MTGRVEQLAGWQLINNQRNVRTKLTVPAKGHARNIGLLRGEIKIGHGIF